VKGVMVISGHHLSVPAGMPALGRCSGPEKLGAAWAWNRTSWVRAPLQRSGRVVLPDIRVRASKTERQSESESVVEAPRSVNRPQTWRTWAGRNNDVALFAGGSLRIPREGWCGGRRDAASARRMVCRGIAGCRPGQTDHGERGKRPVRARLRWQPGKARCPLMRTGRGGVRVVVRGRESRPHGEGGQQDSSMRSRSGGRV
jgi:hypothetical protein